MRVNVKSWREKKGRGAPKGAVKALLWAHGGDHGTRDEAPVNIDARAASQQRIFRRFGDARLRNVTLGVPHKNE